MSEKKIEDIVLPLYKKEYTEMLNDLTKGLDFEFTLDVPDNDTIILHHNNTDITFRCTNGHNNIMDQFKDYVIHHFKDNGVQFIHECYSKIKAYSDVDIESIINVQNYKNDRILYIDHDCGVTWVTNFSSDRYIYGDHLNLMHYVSRNESRDGAIIKFKNTYIMVSRFVVPKLDSLMLKLFNTIDDVLLNNSYNVNVSGTRNFKYNIRGVNVDIDCQQINDIKNLFGVDFGVEFSELLTKYSKYSDIIDEYNHRVYHVWDTKSVNIASCLLAENDCPNRESLFDGYLGDNIEYVGLESYVLSYPNLTPSSEVGMFGDNSYIIDTYRLNSLATFEKILNDNKDVPIRIYDIKKRKYWDTNNYEYQYSYQVRMKIMIDNMSTLDLGHSRMFKESDGEIKINS